MPHVYMLECSDGSLYVGSTTKAVEDRVTEHNLGFGSAYTRRRGRRPVRLVWWEESLDVVAAFEREKQIQKWRREKRIALIEGRADDLPRLARSYSQRDS